jgi:hypothetical protein
VFRLATANELVRPTTLLRSIGQPTNMAPHQFMLRDGFEMKLNAPAQQRLAVFAGIPLQRLVRCLTLPAFIDNADENGPPRLAIVGAGLQTRSHCTLCIARLPGTPSITVYHGHAPVICRRHHRWRGIPPAPGQFDLRGTPEIITASRRRGRLLRSQHDPRWTDTQFRTAEWVTSCWAGLVGLLWHRHLAERWKQRSATIATATGRTPPAGLVMLPETAVLAEIFCDPNGAARSPPPATTATDGSTCTSRTALVCLQGLPPASRPLPTRSTTGWIDTRPTTEASTAAWRPTIPGGRTLDEFLRAATAAPLPAISNP